MTVNHDKLESMSQQLVSLGVKRPVVRSLAFLALKKEASAFEIEQGAQLRQPEVSVALQFMRRKNWIARTALKNEKKGRPIYIYQLKKNLEEIVKEIMENSTTKK